MGLPARYPKATWRGPVDNKTPAGLILPLFGFVEHSEEGTEPGTDSWFHNDASQVSAHLGFPKAGGVDQWVEFTDKAWAEVAGNSHWLSGEFEGKHTEKLTREQLVSAAAFYAWAHGHEPNWFPMHTSNSPTEPGYGWHGMGGDAWGGHFDCPGDDRKHQRPSIIAKAITLLHPSPSPTPHPSPVPVTPAYPGLLEVGSRGRGVDELRAHLAARGWAVKTDDGAFDQKLERIVADFQAEKGLLVDGKVGPATWWAVWHLPIT